MTRAHTERLTDSRGGAAPGAWGWGVRTPDPADLGWRATVAHYAGDVHSVRYWATLAASAGRVALGESDRWLRMGDEARWLPETALLAELRASGTGTVAGTARAICREAHEEAGELLHEGWLVELLEDALSYLPTAD